MKTNDWTDVCQANPKAGMAMLVSNSRPKVVNREQGDGMIKGTVAEIADAYAINAHYSSLLPTKTSL